MKEFREFHKTCKFRSNKRCTYWVKKIECHILSCPLFSQNLTNNEKKVLKKRITDSISFNVTDFDSTTVSTHDLIKEVQKNELLYSTDDKKSAKEVLSITRPVQRMSCVVCGDLINDDKFITITDPSGILIYLHSKGKCDARKEQIQPTREEWLKKLTSNR